MVKHPKDEVSENRASNAKQYERLKSRLTIFPENPKELPEQELCQILFRGKFPGEYIIQKADKTPSYRRLEAAIPPTSLNNAPNDNYSNIRQKQLKAYQEKLNTLARKELIEQINILRESIIKEIKELKPKREWWIDSQYKADFEHWCRMDYWTAEEGIILSLGLDPRKVDPEQFQAEKEYGGLPKEYVDRQEVAASSVLSKKLDTKRNEPKVFIGWLDSKHYSYPDELKVDQIADEDSDLYKKEDKENRESDNPITDDELASLNPSSLFKKPETLKERAYWARIWIEIEKDEPNLTQRDLAARVHEKFGSPTKPTKGTILKDVPDFRKEYPKFR